MILRLEWNGNFLGFGAKLGVRALGSPSLILFYFAKSGGINLTG